MEYPEKLFEGWGIDEFASASFSPHRYAKRVGCLLLAILLFIFVEDLVFDARWLKAGEAPLWLRCVCGLGVFAIPGLFYWALQKDLGARPTCSSCGKKMTMLASLPALADEDKYLVGPSGHYYRLQPIPKTALYRAVECLLKWHACETCRCYINKPIPHFIDLGHGEEAIQDQEASYTRMEATITRLAAARSEKTHGLKRSSKRLKRPLKR